MKMDPEKCCEFFVFGSGFDYCDSMCYDLMGLNNIHYYNKREISNSLLYYLYKVHNSRALNKVVDLPFRTIWFKFFFDYKFVNANKKNVFVFFDSNPLVYNSRFLSWLKSDIPNSRLVILFVNSFRNKNFTDSSYYQKYFDLIYTTDPLDAKERDMIHLLGLHSRIEIPSQKSETDVCFIGSSKGRSAALSEIYSLFKEKGLNVDFTVTGEFIREGINTKRMSYREALMRELKSRCVLEYSTIGQKALTQRSLEAIMYNKLLITNNVAVKKLSYYNPHSMIVFDSLDDLANINDSFFKIEVNYNYSGDFSPKSFLENISNRLI